MCLGGNLSEKLQNPCIVEHTWKGRPQSMIAAYTKYTDLFIGVPEYHGISETLWEAAKTTWQG